jgi:hypothetical protein
VRPDPEDDIDQIDAHSRPRTRVGQFFANAFRPLSARSRRESYSSVSSTAASSAVSSNFNNNNNNKESPLPSPDLLESIAPFSRFVYPDSRSPLDLPLPHSADAVPSPDKPHPEGKLQRSSSSASKKGPTERHVRRNSTLGSTSSNTNTDNTITDSNRDSTVSTPRWRFLPSFLTHSSTPSTASDIPIRQRPRKGDIICLNYDTLDDRGMRRLEGRSDHRPVIGTYAIYL